MRDLRIRCASGDSDRLTFTRDAEHRCEPAEPYNDVHIIVRDRDYSSVLWLSKAQAKRLSEWLAESLSDETNQDVEEI